MERSVLEPIGVDAGSQVRWMVVIFDNPTNTIDEVMVILMEATGCTSDEAFIEMWEAHTLGKASVHFASREECATVASHIATIGVRTEISPEWVS